MTELPAALEQNRKLSQWISFAPRDEKVIVHTGKVELGQGIKTAIARPPPRFAITC